MRVPSPLHRVAPPRTSSGLDARFCEFWTRYPRKVARAYAAQIYTKLMKTEPESHDAILAGLELWRRLWMARGTDTQYIPHASTWLHRRSWEDEIETEIAACSVGTRTRQGAFSVLEWANDAGVRAPAALDGHPAGPRLLRSSPDGTAHVAGRRSAGSAEAGDVLARPAPFRLIRTGAKSAGDPPFPF